MTREEENLGDWYGGGCHCGAVHFEVRIDRFEALECNCSICTMKGFLHLVVERGAFRLVRGADQLATYTFHTHTAKHHFCRICGIHSFYVPRSHPEGFDVNVRCLDGDLRDRFTIELFDGRRWEETVAQIRG
ncbi:MAG: GFA family protein [Deltaproteobacteria bacterium]|nr:GFA family protein [Deltaproteobacteria bacterium]